jgi:GT2 family glycosyltransferase
MRMAPPPLEIIVVSDGDTASSKIAAEFNVKIFQLQQRGGPARARNVGASHARGDILFFIDADVVVPPDLLHRFGEAFHAKHDTAAVIGSYDSDPAAPGVVSQYKNLLHHYVHQHSRNNAATFWGACGAVRRDVFLLLDGFDEGYRRSCVEDIEFGYRLRVARYSILLSKTLQVKHLKQWSFFSLLKADVWDRGVPWTELILRYHQFNNDLNLRHSDRASVIVVYSLMLLPLIGARVSHSYAAIFPLIALLLLLNKRLYKFFISQRGIAFTAAAMGLHWLSFAYSGIAFLFGTVRYASLQLCKIIFSYTPWQKETRPNREVPTMVRGSAGRPGGES